jgi:hypothetical protein
MSLGVPHAHTRIACAYEGVSGVNISSSRRLQLQFLLRLVLPFACSPILALSRLLVPQFTSLYVRQLARIVALSQYALVIPLRSHKITS